MDAGADEQQVLRRSFPSELDNVGGDLSFFLTVQGQTPLVLFREFTSHCISLGGKVSLPTEAEVGTQFSSLPLATNTWAHDRSSANQRVITERLGRLAGCPKST